MIYLDNCATTKIREKVLQKMYRALDEDFGNPSSLHRLGLKSEKKIEEARGIIANYLKVDRREVFFTSGGTESNNIAIQSIINNSYGKRNHIITTKIEHPSILNVFKYYEEQGYGVSYLDVDKSGNIKMEELKECIKENTILVSIIHVNNEIGTIQDIKNIKKIILEKNPHTLLHVDGVQSFGKIDFSLKDLGVDTYSFSGHKIHGPKGIGAIYIRKGLNLKPISFGGNQEKGLRSGTENVAGIIGLGEATRILSNVYMDEIEYVKGLRNYLVEKIQGEIKDVKINTNLDDSTSPYVLSISFLNTRGEVLLHYLEDKDIYVSTTSACSSQGTEKSHVLKSIGLTDQEIEGTIRICFSYENTREDMDYLVEIMKSSVDEIRSIIMR